MKHMFTVICPPHCADLSAHKPWLRILLICANRQGAFVDSIYSLPIFSNAPVGDLLAEHGPALGGVPQLLCPVKVNPHCIDAGTLFKPQYKYQCPTCFY